MTLKYMGRKQVVVITSPISPPLCLSLPLRLITLDRTERQGRRKGGGGRGRGVSSVPPSLYTALTY